MKAPDVPPIGSVVPLPHLGPSVVGTVIACSWCEALGHVVRVREHSVTSAAVHLLYGQTLDEVRASA